MLKCKRHFETCLHSLGSWSHCPGEFEKYFIGCMVPNLCSFKENNGHLRLKNGTATEMSICGVLLLR